MRGGWPSRTAIVEVQRELLLTLSPTVEFAAADATCWACGYRSTISPPQRAHIVAHVNGGTRDPTNFLLLCGGCHRDHPDGASREDQIEWARRREKWQARAERRLGPIIDGLGRAAVDLGGDHAIAEWAAAHGGFDGEALWTRYIAEGMAVTAGPHNLWPNIGAAAVASLRAFSRAPLSLEAVGFVLGNVAWAHARTKDR